MAGRPKVFCVGFQKTGTTSLYAALTRLGWRTAAVVGRGLSAEELRAQAKDLCIETARRFDAAEDMPWPLFYRELDAAFPDSKFILTLRESESWYRSVLDHFGATPDEMHKFVYGDGAATEKIFPFDVIPRVIEAALKQHERREAGTLEAVLAADREARVTASAAIRQFTPRSLESTAA